MSNARQRMQYQPLAHTLIRRIAWLASACVLLFCMAQGALTYVQEKNLVKQSLTELVDISGPMLALAVWDIEPEAVQKQLDTLAANQLVAYVRLDVVTGHHFQSGDIEELEASEIQRYTLQSPRGNETIAHLQLVPDRRYLLRQVAQSVAVLLLGASLLTLLVCLLVAYVLRNNLELPMRKLAGFAANLKRDSLLSDLPRREHRLSARDEIDLLAEGFATLQQGLATHIDTLDEQVEQRTRELATALEDIRRLLERDVLTGCYSKAYLGKHLPLLMQQSEASGQPLCLLFCDLDHFKPVNDELGHIAGDEVLRVAGARIMSQLDGEPGWAVRFGGEEFVVVLPEAGLDAACEMAERMRQALETTIQLDSAQQLRISGSFGVAQARSGESLASLIKRADQCMYEAKAQGRNRVVCEEV